MGSFAKTVFSVLLGWLQGLVSMIWSALTADNGTGFLEFIGENWIKIAVILCAAGLIADFAVYFFRWTPYKVWLSFWRRLKGKGHSPDRESETAETQAAEYTGPERRRYFARQQEEEETESGIGMTPAPAADRYEDPEDDLRRWQSGEPEKEEIRQAPEITKAGYTVPIDSPYRKPGEQRRRRRFRINLLGDAQEDEGIHYYSPRPMVDRKEAYHAPVYPEKWTGSREQDP